MNTLVRSATLAKFSDVARGLGLDPVRMVRHVGLDRQCLTAPDLRVPEASLAAVLEVSCQAAACGNLGLMMGQSWRLSDFGVISLLLQHQQTLRQALAEIQRYRHLLSDSVVLDVNEYPDVAVLHLELVTGRSHPGRHPVELAMGALLSLCRHQLGANWQPRRIHFAHAAPPSTQTHQRVLGPRLEFGSDFNGIVLNPGDLDRVNAASDIHMARYARDMIDAQPRASDRNVAHEVRRALHVLLPRGRGSIEHVGQSLGFSPRTLQRQLEPTGDKFQALLNEVRRDLAVRYLKSGAHTMSQITRALGFAESSAFSRWFSQQFKVAPSRWPTE